MQVTIGREFKFEASHSIDNHPGKCKHLHGHTYTVTVELTDHKNPNTQMVMDFYELKAAVEPLLDMLDHKHLNDLFPHTTVEWLTIWFAQELAKSLSVQDIEVTIREGEGGYARFRTVGLAV